MTSVVKKGETKFTCCKEEKKIMKEAIYFCAVEFLYVCAK